jgi:hypothetical protein
LLRNINLQERAINTGKRVDESPLHSLLAYFPSKSEKRLMRLVVCLSPLINSVLVDFYKIQQRDSATEGSLDVIVLIMWLQAFKTGMLKLLR